MPVPKRRVGKSRRDRRRANFKLHPPTLIKCANCGAIMTSHRVCTSCGYYNGRHVVPVKAS